MWPGTFSLASRHLPLGGTLLFALLAFAGDIGCAVGPGVVGVVSAWAQQNAQIQIPRANGDALSSALKAEMLCAASFPVLLAVIAMRLRAGNPGRGSHSSVVAERRLRNSSRRGPV